MREQTRDRTAEVAFTRRESAAKQQEAGELTPDVRMGGERTWNERRRDDQAALKDRWQEFSLAEEAALKQAFEQVLEEAEQTLADERSSTQKTVSQSPSDLRYQVEGILDDARRELVDARLARASSDDDSTVTVRLAGYAEELRALREESATADRAAESSATQPQRSDNDADRKVGRGVDASVTQQQRADNDTNARRAQHEDSPATWNIDVSQDERALESRWQELSRADEASVKGAYQKLLDAAAEVHEHLEQRLASSAETQTAELTRVSESVERELMDARRAIIQAREATESVAACLDELKERERAIRDTLAAAVTPNEVRQEATSTHDEYLRDATLQRDASATRSRDAARSDAEALETAWFESKEQDQQLKDAYRDVAIQAERTRRELEAVSEDILHGYDGARRLLDVRHVAEQGPTGMSADLAARQQREQQWLETNRLAAVERTREAWDALETELAGARDTVVCTRESQENVAAAVSELERTQAALETLREAARSDREAIALTSRSYANAVASPHAHPRDHAAAVAFARNAEKDIAARGSAHPLHFLIDPDTQELKSRKRRDLTTAAVEIGHEVSHSARTTERFMLEDADFNDWSNRYAETKRIAVFKESVRIEGIAVERRTALMWESLGLLRLPEGQRVRDLPREPGRRR